LLYRPAFAFPPRIKKVYSLRQTTKATVFIDEETTRTYDRTVEWFMTVYAPGEPEKGYQKVVAVVDSLSYTFASDTDSIRYFSQDQAPAPLNFTDATTWLTPLGREVEFTYAPYGDIQKIESPAIAMALNMFQDLAPEDTKAKEVEWFWRDALSHDGMAHITNITRNIPPQSTIVPDSTWGRDYLERIDRRFAYGKVAAAITSFQDRTYTIAFRADSLTVPAAKTWEYVANSFVNGLAGTASVRGEMQLNRYGTIQYVKSTSKAKMPFAANNKTYKQEVESTLSLTLQGQFQW
jgi:hypothetical protein